MGTRAGTRDLHLILVVVEEHLFLNGFSKKVRPVHGDSLVLLVVVDIIIIFIFAVSILSSLLN